MHTYLHRHAGCSTPFLVDQWLLLAAQCSIEHVQALDDEEIYLNIDLMHLREFDSPLYDQLVAYPGEVIPLVDAEARYLAEDLADQELPDHRLLTVQKTTAFLLEVICTPCI